MLPDYEEEVEDDEDVQVDDESSDDEEATDAQANSEPLTSNKTQVAQ